MLDSKPYFVIVSQYSKKLVSTKMVKQHNKAKAKTSMGRAYVERKIRTSDGEEIPLGYDDSDVEWILQYFNEQNISAFAACVLLDEVLRVMIMRTEYEVLKQHFEH